MSESNNLNIAEDSRQGIADENDASRIKIHKEDVLQVQVLHEQITTLQKIAKDNCDNITKLMPLVTLAPMIEQMVEERRAYTFIASKMLKVIGVIAAIIGLVYGAVKLWQEFRR